MNTWSLTGWTNHIPNPACSSNTFCGIQYSCSNAYGINPHLQGMIIRLNRIENLAPVGLIARILFKQTGNL
jgi:hypothetical protein